MAEKAHRDRAVPGGPGKRARGVSCARYSGTGLLDLDTEAVEAVAKLGDPLPRPMVSDRSLRPLLRLPAGEQKRLLQEALAAAGAMEG